MLRGYPFLVHEASDGASPCGFRCCSRLASAYRYGPACSRGRAGHAASERQGSGAAEARPDEAGAAAEAAESTAEARPPALRRACPRARACPAPVHHQPQAGRATDAEHPHRHAVQPPARALAPAHARPARAGTDHRRPLPHRPTTRLRDRACPPTGARPVRAWAAGAGHTHDDDNGAPRIDEWRPRRTHLTQHQLIIERGLGRDAQAGGRLQILQRAAAQGVANHSIKVGLRRAWGARARASAAELHKFRNASTRCKNTPTGS